MAEFQPISPGRARIAKLRFKSTVIGEFISSGPGSRLMASV